MRFRRTSSALLAVLMIASPVANSVDGKLALTVKVIGASPNKGQAVFTLFASKDTFLKNPHSTRIVPIDSDGSVVARVNDLDPGIYAVSVYYDEDSNGKLNTNLFGIPTELVGFSNQARSLFGPPSFRKASFPVSTDHSIEIRLGKTKD
jgi:uncharacterized protein (DUF2141 family)